MTGRTIAHYGILDKLVFPLGETTRQYLDDGCFRAATVRERFSIPSSIPHFLNFSISATP